jgi:hypothetical protein
VEFLEYAGADGAEEYGQAYGQNNADAFARRSVSIAPFQNHHQSRQALTGRR